VEILEENREHITAQAAFALVDYERRFGTFEERQARRVVRN
jgi:hypothetical protein